jgi:hypothetical protein
MSVHAMVVRSLMVLLLVAGFACAAPSRDSAANGVDSAGRERLQGFLRLVGSAPMNVRLVIQDGAGSTTLTGALATELRRAVGAEVLVFGRRDGAAFLVDDYRIVAIDGRPVVMGVVEGETGDYVRLRTPEGELVYVVGATGQFRTGQKIWVQGPRGVVVQTFGTLQP